MSEQGFLDGSNDTLKVGDENAKVTGIITTFLATAEVIEKAAEHRLDLLVCGEVNEWELTEYVRDTQAYGHNLGLIIIGHQPTEEAGMAYLAEWLAPRLPDISHVSSGYPLKVP